MYNAVVTHTLNFEFTESSEPNSFIRHQLVTVIHAFLLFTKSLRTWKGRSFQIG